MNGCFSTRPRPWLVRRGRQEFLFRESIMRKTPSERIGEGAVFVRRRFARRCPRKGVAVKTSFLRETKPEHCRASAPGVEDRVTEPAVNESLLVAQGTRDSDFARPRIPRQPGVLLAVGPVVLRDASRPRRESLPGYVQRGDVVEVAVGQHVRQNMEPLGSAVASGYIRESARGRPRSRSFAHRRQGNS